MSQLTKRGISGKERLRRTQDRSPGSSRHWNGNSVAQKGFLSLDGFTTSPKRARVPSACDLWFPAHQCLPAITSRWSIMVSQLLLLWYDSRLTFWLLVNWGWPMWLLLTAQHPEIGIVVVVFQLLSHVQLFVIPWTAACQASLFFTMSQSLLKLMSVESVMPSNHVILYHPLLLLPSVFPSIRVFSSEWLFHIRWSKYLSFSISPSNEYSGLISFRTDWFDLPAVHRTLKSLL